MENPVVTDAGQTYEKTAIQEHIEHNGKTDPFTREPISGKLYPNQALKRAIQAFIDKYRNINEEIHGLMNSLRMKTTRRFHSDENDFLEENTRICLGVSAVGYNIWVF